VSFGVDALPPLPSGALPADATQKQREAYRAALGFERMLVTRLAEGLQSSAGDEGQSTPYAQLLPEAMADGITAAGGLGLAPVLYTSMSGEDLG
jgi:hypothetical protein